MTPTQVFKYFGSEAKAAKALGYTRQAMYRWKWAKRIPPRSQAHVREIMAKVKSA